MSTESKTDRIGRGRPCIVFVLLVVALVQSSYGVALQLVANDWEVNESPTFDENAEPDPSFHFSGSHRVVIKYGGTTAVEFDIARRTANRGGQTTWTFASEGTSPSGLPWGNMNPGQTLSRDCPATAVDAGAHAGLTHCEFFATNNEPRRVSYIEANMGLGGRIERIFASGHLRLAKPDPAFFEQVRTELAVEPDRLILIDDHRPNVEAAARLGWQTYHYADQDHAGVLRALGLAD